MSVIQGSKMLPHFRFGNKRLCTYCGDPAEGIDHVIPKSYQSEIKRRTLRAGPTTWACKQCNSLLSNTYFSDFQIRCDLVRDKYERKAKKVMWSDAQLEQITSYWLREWIRNKQRMRLWYRYKADWQGSRDFLLNIESLTWEPVLRRDSTMFHKELYDYFWPTLQTLQQLSELIK